MWKVVGGWGIGDADIVGPLHEGVVGDLVGIEFFADAGAFEVSLGEEVVAFAG